MATAECYIPLSDDRFKLVSVEEFTKIVECFDAASRTTLFDLLVERLTDTEHAPQIRTSLTTLDSNYWERWLDAPACGDSRIWLRRFPDETFHSCVTDPPYGLTAASRNGSPRKKGTGPFGRHGVGEDEAGFMGQTWDTGRITNDPEFWAEVLRVLKPGAYLLAFGGTRTYHRMTCAIEDAGFVINDCLAWMYGSGFPKNLNVSREIDKHLGNESKVVGVRDPRGTYDGLQRTSPAINTNWRKAEGRDDTRDLAKQVITEPTTEEAKQWDGWGTALKPAMELIVLAQKPREGTYAENILKNDCGAMNIDGCRIGDDFISSGGNNFNAWRSGENRIDRPDAHGKSSSKIAFGRFPANILFECTCDHVIPGFDLGSQERQNESSQDQRYTDHGNTNSAAKSGARRKDHSAIHTDPDCPCLLLDEQTGILKSGNLDFSKHRENGKKLGIYGAYRGGDSRQGQFGGDAGGASRFFYHAKTSPNERREGLSWLATEFPECLKEFPHDERGDVITMRNPHPTIKPVDLLCYLVCLVTPPDGIVLDPFSGSGTTAIAAICEGVRFAACDLIEAYTEIARARMKWAVDQNS